MIIKSKCRDLVFFLTVFKDYNITKTFVSKLLRK